MRRAFPLVSLAVAAALLTLSWTAGFGFIGSDTYAVLEASRVRSSADLVAIFRSPVADGLPGLYRPVFNLSLAFDYAVWGLDPFGYQLTNAVLFAGCGFALGILASQLVGGGGLVAFWVTPIVFYLHPSHVETLAVIARRPDLLCCLLLALTLIAQSCLHSAPVWLRAFAVCGLSLMAIASKGTGFVVPLLVFAVGAASREAGKGWGSRIVYGVKAAGPSCLAFAIMLAIRLRVLGGVVGRWQFDVVGSLARLPGFLWTLAGRFLDPQRLDPALLVPSLLIVIMLLAVVFTAMATVPRTAPGAGAKCEPGRLAFVGAVWVLGVVALYAAVRLFAPWHFLLLSAGWALICGAAAETLVAGLRRQGQVLRVAAGIGLGAMVALGGWWVRDSPFVVEYVEYRRLDAFSKSALARLRTLIAAAPDGRVIYAPRTSTWILPRRRRATALAATGFSRWSLMAWAAMTFPGRKIHFEEIRRGLRPAADELVVQLGTNGGRRGSTTRAARALSPTHRSAQQGR